MTCTHMTCTVNCEYFVVIILFSDSQAYAKIKRTKKLCNISDNAVQGHLSENYFNTKNYHMKYSQFTVYTLHITVYM